MDNHVNEFGGKWLGSSCWCAGALLFGHLLTFRWTRTAAIAYASGRRNSSVFFSLSLSLCLSVCLSVCLSLFFSFPFSLSNWGYQSIYPSVFLDLSASEDVPCVCQCLNMWQHQIVCRNIRNETLLLLKPMSSAGNSPASLHRFDSFFNSNQISWFQPLRFTNETEVNQCNHERVNTVNNANSASVSNL